MRETCKQCGKSFEITDSELEFFKSKNLNIPKRCKACRDANKNQNNKNQNNKNQNNQSQSNKGASSAGVRSNNSANGSKMNYSSGSGNNNIFKKVIPVVLFIVIACVAIIFFMTPEKGTGSDDYTGISETVTSTEDEVTQISAEETKTPEVTEVPEATEAPEATDAPGTTETPEATDVPEVTEAPEATAAPEVTETPAPTEAPTAAPVQSYTFRSDKLLSEHYEKHGIEMGFASKEAYAAAAAAVINNPEALTKSEKEDGDMVYYVEETNEFVILSTDGYIRTYFLPSAGKAYFDRQ